MYIELRFSLQTIKIEQLQFGNSPQCVRFDLKVSIYDIDIVLWMMKTKV